jgi:hypothetical protein
MRRASRLQYCTTLLLWLMHGAAPLCGTVDRADVSHQAGRYHIALDVTLDAPRERVVSLLSDDARLPEISPAVVSARVLSVTGDGGRRRESVMSSCVFVFCFRFKAEEEVRVLGDGRIHTRIEPGGSDFRSGESLWLIEAAGSERTRIRMTSDREPDFWIPPAVGPWLVERRIRRELLEVIKRIEALAGAEPTEES